jgi:hypothetical protein
MALLTLLASTPTSAAGTGSAVSVSGYNTLLINVTCSPLNSSINFHVQTSVDGTNWYTQTTTTLTGNTTYPLCFLNNFNSNSQMVGEQVRLTWTSPGSAVTIQAQMSATT